MKNAQQLKAKTRNVARENNIEPMFVMRRYMIEQFLVLLASSKYQKNFVLKGGILISSIIGIGQRTTLDVDFTSQKIPFSEKGIQESVLEICNLSKGNNIRFRFEKIEEIHDGDQYGGYRVHLMTIFDDMRVPIKLDFTTGDIITPRPSRYEYPLLFGVSIELLTYNLETIVAEKLESIISRSVANTRMKDYYDLFAIDKHLKNKMSNKMLQRAINNTFKYRDSEHFFSQIELILQEISTDSDMARKWEVYTRENPYAKGIQFTEVVKALSNILI